jgi:hypothetical protein
MANANERRSKQDRNETTKQREERSMRQSADSTGQERGAMKDSPTKAGVAPDAHNTADPKPFPTKRNRSGPARKFEAD